mgnify:CR=1 FL=1
MQVSIAKKTVVSMIKSGNEIEVIMASAMDAKCVIESSKKQIEILLEKGSQFENVSVVEHNENIVFTIDDKFFLKMFAIYVKAAKIVAPVIKPLIDLSVETQKLIDGFAKPKKKK